MGLPRLVATAGKPSVLDGKYYPRWNGLPRVVGANMPEANYFTGPIFLDYLRHASSNTPWCPWFTGNSGSFDTGEQAYVQMDADGNPTSLTAGNGFTGTQQFTKLFTYICINMVQNVPGATYSYPPGNMTLAWDGPGIFVCGNDFANIQTTFPQYVTISGKTITSTAPQGTIVSITFDAVGQYGFSLQITGGIAPSGYLKFSRGYMVPTQYLSDYLAGEVWHPIYKASYGAGLTRYNGPLRSMGAQKTNQQELQLTFSSALANGATSGVLSSMAGEGLGPNIGSFQGSISGTTLTVTSGGLVTKGANLNGAAVAAGTQIVSQLTGTTGGVGTYQVNISQNVPGTVLSTVSTTTQPGGTLTNGTYTGVALSNDSSSGSGAVATIVVSSGAVSSLTITSGGSGYAVGDTLYIPQAAIPGATSNGIVTVTAVHIALTTTGWLWPNGTYAVVFATGQAIQVTAQYGNATLNWTTPLSAAIATSAPGAMAIAPVQQSWASRPKLSNLSWASLAGMPLEAIIQHSNEMGLPAWTCAPAATSYVDSTWNSNYAQLVYNGSNAVLTNSNLQGLGFTGLNPTLKLFDESSNEVWNFGSGYRQSNFYAMLSVPTGYYAANGNSMYTGGYELYGVTTAQRSQAFQTVFGASFWSRVCPLIMTQFAPGQGNSFLNAAMNSPHWGSGPVYPNIGAWGFAPYFGTDGINATDAAAIKATADPVGTLWSCAWKTSITYPSASAWMMSTIATAQSIVSQAASQPWGNLPKVGYEGGSALDDAHDIEVSVPGWRATVLTPAQRDSRMALAYCDPTNALGGPYGGYLEALRTVAGMSFINQLTHIGSALYSYSVPGGAGWGDIENEMQTLSPPSSAPSKIQGIWNFAASGVGSSAAANWNSPLLASPADSAAAAGSLITGIKLAGAVSDPSSASASLTTGSAPLIIGTDFLDVPTGAAPAAAYVPAGLTAANYGGENGAGGYLTIYGRNFGDPAKLGTAAGALVYIGGQLVANHRYLVKVKGCQNGDPRDFWALGVQIGSANVQALATGVAAALSVVVSGTASNVSDPWGNALNVVPIQAPIFFVDETNGNDANAGTFSAPLQHAQNFNSSTGLCTGACASNTAVSGGKSNGVQAGTQFVYRAGTYAFFSHDSRGSTISGNDRLITLYDCTGCDPTNAPSGGLQGVNAGYLKFCAYPGGIGANAPEEPYVNQGTSGGKGFIYGSQSSEAAKTTPYGFTGYSHYIAISGFKATIDPAVTESSAAPIYADNYADSWRVTNCNLSFPNTNHMLSAAISGDCNHSFLALNYIHDVYCDSGLQNHAIYMDGGTVYSSNNVIALNYITNITGGSGVQFYNQAVSGTDSLGNAGHSNNVVAWNLVDGVGKYCLNWADSTQSGRAYGNILKNAGVAEVRFNTNNANVSISHYNNAFFTSKNTSSHSMVQDDWTMGAGSVVEFFDNLLVVGTGGAIAGWFGYNSATPYSWKNNRYFDQTGVHSSAGTGGTHTGESYGDPLVTTDWTDFTPQGGSPLIGAGAAYGIFTPPGYDFALGAQPRSGQTNPSIGPYA